MVPPTGLQLMEVVPSSARSPEWARKQHLVWGKVLWKLLWVQHIYSHLINCLVEPNLDHIWFARKNISEVERHLRDFFKGFSKSTKQGHQKQNQKFIGIHITDWFCIYIYITNHIKLVTYTPCLTENIQKPYQYFLLVVTTLKIPNRTIPLTRKDRLALLKFGSLCPPKSLRRTQCFCPKPLQSRFGASSTSGNHHPVCLQNPVNRQYGYTKVIP